MGEDPPTPGLLPKGIDPGTVTIPKYRVNKNKETHTVTTVAGPILETKSSDFSGEILRERNFGRSITAPTTLFPLIGCGVDSFSPN